MQYSVVNFKELNEEFRIDSEYYHKEILDNIQLLNGKKSDFLVNLVKFIVGPFGSTVTADKYVEESKYRYIRNKDINDFVVKDDDPALIPEEIYSTLKQFHIIENDLLITVVGTLGKVAIAQKKDAKSIFSCKSTILRVKEINPFYLLVYLNSRIGNLFSLRAKRGAIQEGLNLFDLKEILVFLPTNEFQKKIEQMVKFAFELSNNSQQRNKQSENMLLQELCLLDWKPKHNLWIIKNFSETQDAQRIDAEYYQPKYDEILKAIKSYPNGFDRLEKLITIKDKNITPDNETQYKYIELSNIANNGEITGCTKGLGKDLPTRARRMVKTNDLIISSIEGSLESIALVTEQYNNCLCSNGFYVVDSDFYNSETLLCLMKSCIGQQQLKKGCNGTILTAINKDEFSKIILPKIKDEIQKEIKNKISESYKLKYQSKQLIEIAKHGVEIAIEENEEIATNWINEELNKIGVSL